MDDLTNDVIDSRDVIKRRDDLQDELTACGTFKVNEFLERYHAPRDELNAEEIEELTDWLNEFSGEFDIDAYEDDVKELEALNTFIDKCSNYGDFDHGTSVIADDYFKTYAQDLANDIGAIDQRSTDWPCNHIDWDAAADDLKHDYMSIDFNDETYWIQA